MEVDGKEHTENTQQVHGAPGSENSYLLDGAFWLPLILFWEISQLFQFKI